jgi:hypothetical protein
MAETTTSPQPSLTHSPASPASPWRTAALVIGDAVSFLIFAGVGRDTHGEATGLAALGQVAWTALPFALGWFLVSPWVGAYRRAATDTILRMLTRTELAWLAAYPAALILRLILAHDPTLTLTKFITFAIVILLANAAFLGVWRTAFALVARLVARRPAARG